MFRLTKRVLAGLAAIAALALGASAIAGAASSAKTTSTTQSSSAAPARPPFNGPAPGTAAHEDAETPVTGDAAAKAQAAAVKGAGGGTAGAVTTDYSKNGYEVTLAKSDGSKVEVHLDSSFNVLQGPFGHGGAPPGPGGPPPSG